MKPYYDHNGIVIFHGDSRDIPECFRADVLVTDPPYGVGFTGKVTKHSNKRGVMPSYVDDDAYFSSVVLPVVQRALTMTTRAAIFSGVRKLIDYPRPADIGGIVCPNGGGRSPWGFSCFNPVLYYGKPPPGRGARPTSAAIYHPGMHVTGEDWIQHPCPKPLTFLRWLLPVVSLEGEVVLDPFMGSGTTLVAAKHLGRKAVGVELEERYCEIAAQRLGQDNLPLQVNE